METLDWLQCLTILEREMAAFCSSEDLEVCLRRAGRRYAETARSHLQGDLHAPEELMEKALPLLPDLQLEPTTTGYRLESKEGSLSFGLGAWCAGFLEGCHPQAKTVQLRPDSVKPGEPHRWFLDWADSKSAVAQGFDFNLPGSGPLTPFQMAQVADLSEDAILFVDIQKRIRAWNHGAEELFGYTAKEAIGQYYDLVVPEDLRRGQELDQISAETEREGTLRNFITRRRTKDGRELTVSLTRTLVHNRSGELVGFGVILRDITEAERLKQALENARQLAHIGEMASQVAHEVRNPLAGIHGALQIMQRRLQIDEESQAVFEDVAAEIFRLDRLVTDLMRFGRPAGPKIEVVDWTAWLRDWTERIGREVTSRNAQLQFFGSETVPVRLDLQLMEQILRNLLENSLEAKPSGSVIKMRLRIEQQNAKLLFQDNGPGVADEIREEILKPFFTTKTRGSGLGLPICVRHVTSLGGTLEVHPHENGARIVIQLPLASS